MAISGFILRIRKKLRIKEIPKRKIEAILPKKFFPRNPLPLIGENPNPSLEAIFSSKLFFFPIQEISWP